MWDCLKTRSEKIPFYVDGQSFYTIPTRSAQGPGWQLSAAQWAAHLSPGGSLCFFSVQLLTLEEMLRGVDGTSFKTRHSCCHSWGKEGLRQSSFKNVSWDCPICPDGFLSIGPPLWTAGTSSPSQSVVPDWVVCRGLMRRCFPIQFFRLRKSMMKAPFPWVRLCSLSRV